MSKRMVEWYNSSFGDGLGFAAIILALGFGLRGCADFINSSSTSRQKAMEMEKIRLQYKLKLQEAYINNNDILNEFYVIDGEIDVTKLD